MSDMDKKRFIKISDGYTSCMDSFEQGLEHIRMLCEEGAEGDEWTFKIVRMTEEEHLELPEFTGW